MASTDKRVESGIPLIDLVPSFVRHLRAENKADTTVETYTESIEQLDRFLRDQGMPVAVTGIRREHVEAFIAFLLERRTPNTASNRFRGLQRLFKWAVEEGEIRSSPMERMQQPKVPENPPAVLTDEQIIALLKTCAGNSFDERRDNAIIRFFLDTGCRKSEVAGLTRFEPNGATATAGVNLDGGWAVVVGKGDRVRMVGFGARTARALDRYLRVRASHKAVECHELWLGRRGPLTASGIYQQSVKYRAQQAGIDLFTHQFRHTFTDRWLASDGSESDLMTLGGWKSSAMIRRYGAARATERALESHKTRSLGDRF